MPDIVARIAKYNNDTHRVAYYDIYENDTFTERLSPLRDSNNPEGYKAEKYDIRYTIQNPEVIGDTLTREGGTYRRRFY